MNIVIPTHHRLPNLPTLRALHPDLHRDVVLIVRPEAVELARAIPSVRLSVLPAGPDDIRRAFQHALDTFDGERFLLMDDDLTRFYRRIRFHRPDDPRLVEHPWSVERVESADEQRAMCQTWIDELDRPMVGLVSPQQGQSGCDTNLRRSGKVASQAIAIDGPLARRLGCRFDAPGWFDSDFSLQFMDRGYDCVRHGGYYTCSLPQNPRPTDGDWWSETASRWPGAYRPGNPLRTGNMKKRGGGHKPFMFMGKRFLLERRRELGITSP